MANSNVLQVLGLSKWPFSLAPDKDAELPWADRAILEKQIHRLIRRLCGEPASSLHLLWADFGAGKSYTLLYMRQLALTETEGQLCPVYAVLPKGPRSFVDVYRAAVHGIGFDALTRACADARKKGTVAVWPDVIPGFVAVLDALRIGGDNMKRSAKRWLIADPSLTRAEIEMASLPSKIRTSDEAIASLSALIRLLLASGHSRVLLMIDEFQRVGKLRAPVRDDINDGLHTIFNECPKGLSLILSFSFGSASNIRHHLNKELIDRAGLERISIPSMSSEDATVFLTDLLEYAKSPGQVVKIDESVIPAIVGWLESSSFLKPRWLVKATAHVLSYGAMDISDGAIGAVDGGYAQEILGSLVVSEEEEQEEE